MRVLKPAVHIDRHKAMLALQAQIRPFPATLRELQQLWNLRTTSSVRRTLDYLVKHGLCVTREHGRATSYYAVVIADR
jgi:hypothetical protein